MSLEQHRLGGVVVPMVSPFTPAGEIDEEAVGHLVEHLLGAGHRALFVLGTTGEAASIHPDEKTRLVGATVRAVAGRAVVYAGISGNCLRESIEAGQAYARLGADIAVAHPPFYFPVPDSHLERYFQRLAESIPLPLVIYNIPQTTHVMIPLDVIERLSHHPRIVGLKDSAPDTQRWEQVIQRLGGREDFVLLIGTGAFFGRGLRLGAHGLVPSEGNCDPALYQAMVDAAGREDWPALDRLQQEVEALCGRVFAGCTLGEKLASLKVRLAEMGLCGPTVLPPLD